MKRKPMEIDEAMEREPVKFDRFTGLVRQPLNAGPPRDAKSEDREPTKAERDKRFKFRWRQRVSPRPSWPAVASEGSPPRRAWGSRFASFAGQLPCFTCRRIRRCTGPRIPSVRSPEGQGTMDGTEIARHDAALAELEAMCRAHANMVRPAPDVAGFGKYLLRVPSARPRCQCGGSLFATIQLLQAGAERSAAISYAGVDGSAVATMGATTPVSFGTTLGRVANGVVQAGPVCDDSPATVWAGGEEGGTAAAVPVGEAAAVDARAIGRTAPPTRHRGQAHAPPLGPAGEGGAS